LELKTLYGRLIRMAANTSRYSSDSDIVSESIFKPANPEQLKNRLTEYMKMSDLSTAAGHGWYDRVMELIDQGTEHESSYNNALRYAAWKGHTDIVKLLIPLSDPDVVQELKDKGKITEMNESIFVPLDNDQLKERKDKFFITLDRNDYDLEDAADIGWYDRVKELLDQGEDPKAENSGALVWAAEEGHTDIVRLLIPYSDVKANNSEALINAARYGHTDVVKLLIPHSDPEAVQYLKNNGWITESITESLFASVGKDEYEDRRNNAGADIVFYLKNDPGTSMQIDEKIMKLGFRYDGSKPGMQYFSKHIPYAGHRELAEKITDIFNREAGKNIVISWRVRGRHP